MIFRSIAGGAETVLHVASLRNDEWLVLPNFPTVADEVARSLTPASA